MNSAERVPNGARLGIGGVHLSRLPIALIQKIAALSRKDFTFISWGGGLALELLLEAGAVRKACILLFQPRHLWAIAALSRSARKEHD